MTIVYIVLAILTIYLYISKKYISFLLCYVALMSNIFMLDTIGSSIRGSDLCFFMNIVLLPFALSRRIASKMNDKKIIFPLNLLLLYIIFEFIITTTSGADTVGYALKVARIPLMFLAYYPFSTIPLDKYKKFIRIMFVITIIQGVLFLLQFVGIKLLAGRFSEGDSAYTFALNIPTFIYFYLFYSLEAEYVKKYKYIILVSFIAILLLTFVRAIIISTMLCLIVYIVMQRGIKRSLFLIIAILVITPIAFRVMEKKTQTHDYSHSTTEEIKLLFTGIDNIRNLGNSSGTSIFRIAMLIERFDYLIKNPEHLLFGVGTIHEDSPKCYNRFFFELGTKNEERHYGKCMIESGDITWVPITLRYGLIGIAIHMAVLILIAKMAYNRKDLLKILFPLILLYFIKSFDGPLFERPIAYLEISLYLSLFARCYTEKRIIK